jgi:predicted RNase H-related nuclease YkuK (DUF458 family)
MVFKRLADRKVVDLVPYTLGFLVENLDHTIYVGTDSQNVGESTIYATVIVFHNSGKGGHVLYSKVVLPKINDRWTRLWKEVEFSVQAAEQLKDEAIPKVGYIDLDLNPDPKYKSNQVLRSAIGYVESMGYKARVKPNAIMASCVADNLIH